MKNISQRGVRAVQLALAPKQVEERITRQMDALTGTIDSLKADCSKLRRLKIGLMQDFPTGGVCVPISATAP